MKLKLDGRALLTDLYQLTMAYGYWKAGTGRTGSGVPSVFSESAVQAGSRLPAGWPTRSIILDSYFTDEDLAFLAMLTGNDGKPLFEPAFLEYLGRLEVRLRRGCAFRKARWCLPTEPLLRIKGPILQCQLVETALLNLLNFQSLIATKAARVCLRPRVNPSGIRIATSPRYGRRAGSQPGGLHRRLCGDFECPGGKTIWHSGARHACAQLGDVLRDEREAFLAYAEAMPTTAFSWWTLMTRWTACGMRLRPGKWLRERGHELAGIRLDSGDLAWLSIEAQQNSRCRGFSQGDHCREQRS